MRFFSAPKTLADIVAPLENIAVDLDTLARDHAVAIENNTTAIKALQEDTDARNAETAKAAVVREKLRSFLAI